MRDARLDPADNGLARNSENALNPSQTTAFFTGFENGFLLLSAVAYFRLQHAISATILAMVLTIAAFVPTIANDVSAPTSGTLIRDSLLYHREHFHLISLITPPLPRIITLGDSFTQGSTADIGKSYVELLKAEIPAAEIWNLAIASTGTKQAIQAYDQFAPRFRPQLTIHGFCMNDFTDNLLLNYADLQFRNAEGNIMFFPRYPQAWRDRWGRPIQLPQKLVIRYAIAGYPPPLSDLEARLGVTQLGTLALRLLDRAASAVYSRSHEEVEKTRQYLAQLRHNIMAIDSNYLVLLIPEPVDIRNPGARVANAIMLMEELGIPYLNPIPLLTEEDYVPHPDNHWNNAGHQKIGALLSDCVQRFIDTGNLAECDSITMPRPGR